MENKTPASKKLSFSYLIRQYAWPFRKYIFLLIGVTVIANLITATQPVILSGVINTVLGEKTEQAVGSQGALDLNTMGDKIIRIVQPYANSKGGLLVVISITFLLLVIFSGLLNYCAYLIALRIETRSAKLIQTDIVKHVLSLDMALLNRQKSGNLMALMTNDAKVTANAIGPLVRSLFHFSVLIIIYGSYLLSTSIWLTLGSVLLILMQFTLTSVIKRPIGRNVRKQLEKVAELSACLQESFSSFRLIKSFGAELFEQKKLGQVIDQVVAVDMRAGTIKHIEEPARGILDSFAIIGIVLIAGIQVMRGTLSIQGFALFIFVGKLLIDPINKLSVTVTWIQALLASYSRIYELIENKPQIKDGSESKITFNNEIIIRDVSFSYGEAQALKNINLAIKKGEIIAIVGPSGAGKSTLVDLILRFYDPGDGRVMMDAEDIREFKQAEYRKIFGVVSQQNIMFNDTVSNNIIYGRSGLTEKDIIEASKIANAYEFIQELPRGFDTVIGERGVLLSGGQCQRLAIARAVAGKPEILILDEATSSLDSEAESQVQKAIDKVLEKATAIIIAHRLSTILHANKIVVLKEGKIEAIGVHQELLKNSPTYQLLYNLQFRNISIAKG